jgi:hypothetical protein
MNTNEACQTMQAGMTECIICVNDVQGTVSINCTGGTVNYPPDTNGNNNNNNNNNDNNNNNNQPSTQPTVVDGNPNTQPTVLSIPTAPVVNFSWREYANNEVDFKIDVDFVNTLLMDFGEGGGDVAVNHNAVVTHKFATADTFSVVLTDHYGGSHTKNSTKWVTTNGLSAAASFDFNVGGLTIFFRNTSTVRGQAVWNFSDGTLLTGEKVYHKFSDLGVYSASLTVRDMAATVSFEIRPSIVLTWSDNSSNEDGFRIEKSLDGGSTWETVKTVAANATSSNVDAGDGVDIFASQKFRVFAYNGVGDSGPSNEVTSVCSR